MQSTEKEGKGYPWLFFHLSGQQKLTLLVSLVIVAISVGFFLWCTDVSDDRGGDSFVGLVFALTSMIFLSLAAVAFSRQRRARKRSVGELNAVLNWHICFGMIALVMVFLHADGNYNPRTGTYALYALVALVISGMVGRTLDRLMPRLIAQEVHKALTAKGEDRIKSISHTLRSVSVQKSQELSLSQPSQSSAPDSGSLGGAETPGEQGMFQSWDIAYVSLEDRLQDLNQFSDCTVAELRSVQIRSGVFSPDTKEQIGALEEIEQAHERELFFRYSIRYWRIFHRVLAVVTVGLTLWHIEYALALIIPAFQKFGLSYLLPWP